MTYNFFLIDKKDAQDGTRVGYAYAVANKDKWISVDGSALASFLTIGYVKGCDYIVHDEKAYMILKSYTDIDDKSTLIVATESISGCDTKKVFNNINHSSIIVDRKAESEEETENP